MNPLIITFFFQKVVPISLHIFPTLLYTAAIARGASLCPFQVKFVVSCPAVVAYEV
jgi:hypothetical protein